MQKGLTKDISLTPVLVEGISDTDRFSPVQIEMYNVRYDDNGHVIKRPGYEQEWDTTAEFPVMALIPEGDGYAMLDNSDIYVLGDSVSRIEASNAKIQSLPRWEKYNDDTIVCSGISVKKVNGLNVTNLVGAPAAKYIAVISSYIFYAGYHPTQFQWVLNDPENFGGTGSGSANIQKTGTIKEMIAYKDRLLFFKEREVEVWSFKGARTVNDSPVARYPGGDLHVGLGAQDSVVRANDRVYWFANDDNFYVYQGGVAQIISDSMKPRIDEMANKNFRGFDIRKENLIMWLNETDGTTLLYDYSKQRWLEDARWEPGWQSLPFSSYMELNGKQYFGSRNCDGLIHEWSGDSLDDNGRPIRVYRRFKTLVSERRLRTRIDRLILRREGAVATSSVASPVVSLRYRWDKGHWSNWEQRTLGEVGKHDPYVEFYHMGMGREFELEIAETDAVRFLLTNATINYQEMAA